MPGSILKYYPAPPPSVEWQKIDDTAFLLQLETGHSCVLDGTGTSMWNLMSGKRTVAQIVKELLETYDTTQENLARETDKFIRSLEERQFIVLNKKPTKLPKKKPYVLTTQ